MKRRSLLIVVAAGSYLQDLGGFVYGVGESMEKWGHERFARSPGNMFLTNAELDARLRNGNGRQAARSEYLR